MMSVPELLFQFCCFFPADAVVFNLELCGPAALMNTNLQFPLPFFIG
jgi:hypothetical protein